MTLDPLDPLDSSEIPDNVTLGDGTIITGPDTFRRFRSSGPESVRIGRFCTIDFVSMALGPSATLTIGDHCLLSHVQLMAEEAIRIGDHVEIAVNAVIADSDFHPIRVADRVADAEALSPISSSPRPRIASRPVVIGDGVWIGPNSTVLKGVSIGSDAIIEPGSLVTNDVAPGSRVAGSPARVVADG
jgi:acetyltransferase-like isoleucine patch superfamily enzyme